MRWLCFILICWSTPLHAGWQEDLFSLLPQKLQELQLNKTTPKDAALLIGKPALIKGEKQYWVYDDFKYALELTFKEQSFHASILLFRTLARVLTSSRWTRKTSRKASKIHRAFSTITTWAARLPLI
jgi:hypothetical protein